MEFRDLGNGRIFPPVAPNGRIYAVPVTQESQVEIFCLTPEGVIGSGIKVRIPRHSDTQPTLIRTPVPRSFGQAVGAQRRRGGIVSPGWLASSISASVCALIHPSD